MGRLFWKFFIVFLLALLIVGVSAGTLVWIRNQANLTASTTNSLIDVHAEAFVSVASDIYKYAGEEALKNFLLGSEQTPYPKIFAIDEYNQELLGRQIAPITTVFARQLYQQGRYPNSVKLVTGPDKKQLLLFASFPTQLIEPVEDKNGSTGALVNRPHPEEPKPLLLGIVIFSGLAAALLFSAFLAWYFTTPIRVLRQAFSEVSQGLFNTRIADKMGSRDDELAELGENFDDMTSTIEKLIESQQRLLHDVSHELRSPLARMQAAIGLVEHQPERAPETLVRLERDSQRMSDLVGELLVLSRMEAGANHAQREWFNLNDMLEEIIEDARFEAAQKHVMLHYKENKRYSIFAIPELLQRAVENILRNAIKFSPHKAKILIHVEESNNQFLIRIQDQGPGVEESRLETIFEPFYRSELSREQGGTGLGLAIAKHAIESHKGVIRAKNAEQGGLIVELQLPKTKK